MTHGVRVGEGSILVGGNFDATSKDTESFDSTDTLAFRDSTQAVCCNHDLLLEIFQHVQKNCFDRDSVSRSCRAWKDSQDVLVKKLSLNHTQGLPHFSVRFCNVQFIDLSQVSGSVSDVFLELMAREFSERLLELQILVDEEQSLASPISDRGLTAISRCTKLRRLALSALERCTFAGYVDLFQGCCGLEQLQLNNLYPRIKTDPSRADQERDLGYRVAQALFGNCYKLSSLNLSSQIFDDLSLPLFFGCSTLRDLTLDGSFTLEHLCLQTLSFKCSLLQTLTWVTLKNASALPSRRPQFFGDLFRCCPGLLSLRAGNTFSDEVFQLDQLTSLTELSISSPDHMNRWSLIELLKANKSLTSVEVSAGCRQDEVEVNSLLSAAASHCPRLTRLVDTSGRISDYSLHSIVFTTTLQNLDLSSSTITSVGLQVVASACHSLQEIYLTSCSRVEDHGLQYLTAGCMGLRTIHIQRCSKLTNLGLVSLATCCCLEDLDVSHSQLDDATLLAILRGTPRMKTLGLAACSQLTDASAVAACPTLISVNLDGVQAVSNQSIRAIAENCGLLETLRICRTRITSVGLDYLGRYAKRLKLLAVSGHNFIPEDLCNVSEACVWLKDLILRESTLKEPRMRPGCRLNRGYAR